MIVLCIRTGFTHRPSLTIISETELIFLLFVDEWGISFIEAVLISITANKIFYQPSEIYV